MLNQAERVTVASIIVTTLLGAVEVAVFLRFGIVTFFAAGLDALFDTATSIGVLIGLKVSGRPADRGHLYGHMQAETLVSLFLAGALIFSAVRIDQLAIEKIFAQTPAEVSPELFLLATFTIVLFSALARYKIKIGRLSRKNSVVADGYHTLSDAFSSATVLAGLVLMKWGYIWADAVASIIISLVILRWGLAIGYDALNVLMGASPGTKFISRLKDICMDVPGVSGCHKCRARRVGSRIHADMHVLVDPKLSVEDSHRVATKVERSLKTRIPELASVVVHIEPVRKNSRGKMPPRRPG
ncbi:MAG: cation diffusion facilitator family transporter [Candidatus Hadarchaeum sp.]|uniref:cation diffusion facilitator family transporter n=1 Tax=Candidatus Hadarchaeum sp. TaxID=2883567 RepID=UPI003D138BA3